MRMWPSFAQISPFFDVGMITLSLYAIGVGLKYTSASLGAAILNTLPVITFLLALLLRYLLNYFNHMLENVPNIVL